MSRQTPAPSAADIPALRGERPRDEAPLRLPGTLRNRFGPRLDYERAGGRIDPGWFLACPPAAASHANRAPRCGGPYHRGRPPFTICTALRTALHFTAFTAVVPAVLPDRPREPAYPPARDLVSLRALLRDARQQSADLGLPVPAVSPQGPDRRELPCLRPSRDRFRVHPEHRCDLGRREQRLGLGCACRHVDGLSSWTGTAILRLRLFLTPVGSLPWMSHIVRSDHIAITSGDKSTTRSKVSDASHPVAPPYCVTLRNSSDTDRRNGRIRKSHPRLSSAS
jgi:hypothetical protein